MYFYRRVILLHVVVFVMCTCLRFVIMIVSVIDTVWLSRIFFFFQAEDGIRDLVRSRGLGDVYKRQEVLALVAADRSLGEPLPGGEDYLKAEIVYAASHEGALHLDDILGPVSYTHLTLPTSDLV